MANLTGMARTVIADMAVEFTADSSDLDRGFAQVEGKMGRFAGKLDKLQGRMSRAGDWATTRLTMPIVAGMGLSVKAASDLEESANKASVVFKGSAPQVQRWAKTAASSFGQSRRQALAAASDFGNMFNTLGLGEEETAKMSTTMVELASDMASFENIEPQEALDKLRSGLAGEAEPLRRHGVLLSEAAVEEKAYQMGIAKTGEKLTEQQKVQARYALILEQTKNAHGDFARTQDSLANKTRTAKALWEDASASLGESLLPIMTDLATAAAKVAEWFNGLSDKQKKLLLAMAGAVAAGGPLMKFGSGLIGASTGAFRLGKRILSAAGLIRSSRMIDQVGEIATGSCKTSTCMGKAAGNTAKFGDAAKSASGKAGGLLSKLGRLGRFGLWGAGTAAVLTGAYYGGKWLQKQSDQLAAKTMGGVGAVRKYQSISSGRFGGAAAREAEQRYRSKLKAGSISGRHGLGIGWFASGGDFIARRPQVIGVGERGPERVQITPQRMMRTQDALARQRAITKNYLILGNREIELVTKEVARTARKLGRR